jgi:hypothetical protein
MWKSEEEKWICQQNADERSVSVKNELHVNTRTLAISEKKGPKRMK